MAVRPLRVLMVQDSPTDARLLEEELQSSGYDPVVEQVSSAEDMRGALTRAEWDLILSDYSLSQFRALEALAIVKETGLDLPFIVVADVVRKDVAVECIKEGAHDFLSKNDLTRLAVAVERESRETEIRRAHKQAAKALAESEERFRRLFDHMLEGFAYCRMLFENNEPQDFIYLEVNSAFEKLTGLKNVAGRKVSEVIPGIRESDPELLAIYGRVALTGKPERFETHVAALGLWFSISVYSPEREHFVAVFDVITARKQAEEQMKTLFTAVEQSPDTVVITDLNGLIEYVNPAFEKLTGYSKAEAIGRTPALLKSGKHEMEFYQQMWKSILSGQEFQAEFINKKKNGEIYYHEATIAPIKDSNGKITHFVAGGRDITRRKQTEEQLMRFTAIIEATSDLVGISDRQGKVLYVNPAGRRMLGLGEDEDLTSFDVGVTHPEGMRRMVLEEAIPSAIRDGSWSGETVFLSRDGREIPISQVILAFKDPKGDVLFLSTIARDISEMKRAERALIESEERYRTLFQESKDVIFISTPEGKFVDMNPAGLQLFGYASPADLSQIDIGRDLYVNPGDRLTYQSVLEKQGYVQDYEQAFKTRNGEKLLMLETSNTIRDENGKTVAYRGILRDVTHLKQLQRQFLHSQKMETIGRLAGGVAHDFNNILMAVSGYCELLLIKMPKADPLRLHVQEILKAQKQGASLTRQLLAFSRKQVLELKVLDLNIVVSNMENMLQRLIGEDIDLLILTSQDSGMVEADPGQIEQVIMNLAVNSRDAMPRGGRLTIEISNEELNEEYASLHLDAKPGPHVMLSVKDNGHGMDQETLSHVFEPFFTTKDMEKGTGLGLATVYGIVTQSRGSIDVCSEPGQGTTFKIYLPRLGGTGKGVASEQAAGVLAGGSETILLVDDNESIRSAIGELMKMKGYNVLLAGDGKEALAVSRNHAGPIDLLVTDVVMPGMSGRELAQQLSAERAGIKVLYMSGYTDDAVFRHGILDSDSAFLHKPAPMATFMHKIRQLLD